MRPWKESLAHLDSLVRAHRDSASYFRARVLYPVITLAVAAGAFPGVASAELSIAVIGGAQCDAPAVSDGASFSSTCSLQPLAGAALGFPFPGPRQLSLEVEGQYARRSFGSEAFATDTEVRATFIELALLGTWSFYESASGLRLGAVAGPQIGILQDAHRRFRDVDQDVKDLFRPADFKLVTALRVTRRRLSAEGGVAWGLTNLDDTNQQEIRSRALYFKLGLRFTL